MMIGFVGFVCLSFCDRMVFVGIVGKGFGKI